MQNAFSTSSLDFLGCTETGIAGASLPLFMHKIIEALSNFVTD